MVVLQIHAAQLQQHHFHTPSDIYNEKVNTVIATVWCQYFAINNRPLKVMTNNCVGKARDLRLLSNTVRS
jgi:hypothetical protein